MVVNWSVDNPRDSTYYSFDNGVTWIGSSTHGETLASDLKSGAFNILSLTPNQTYNINPLPSCYIGLHSDAFGKVLDEVL